MHYTALKSISPNRDSNDHGYKNLDSKLNIRFTNDTY